MSDSYWVNLKKPTERRRFQFKFVLVAITRGKSLYLINAFFGKYATVLIKSFAASVLTTNEINSFFQLAGAATFVIAIFFSITIIVTALTVTIIAPSTTVTFLELQNEMAVLSSSQYFKCFYVDGVCWTNSKTYNFGSKQLKITKYIVIS